MLFQLLMGAVALLFVAGGACLLYVNQSIGDTASLETRVQTVVEDVSAQRVAVHNELPEVSDVDQLIRDSRGATSIDSSQLDLSIQQGSGPLDDDAGHGEDRNEKLVEEVSHARPDGQPADDSVDILPGQADEGDGTVTVDVNPEGQPSNQ